MTLEEIKQAVNDGKTVCWVHTGYVVVQDGIGQWFIECRSNNDYIGLTWQDGVTLNGEEEDFFIL